MNTKLIVTLSVLAVVVLLAGNTHRFLSSSSDPCQQDISHLNHVNELPMFHCIGHTEFAVAPDKKELFRVAKWNHIHTWMTLDWHIEQGFTKEHAIELIAHNKPIKQD